MGRSSRQAASDISWDKMAEKAERDLEIRTRRRIERIKLGQERVTVWAMKGKKRKREGEKK